MSFSKDFAWGVATAAYQIEGACDADGKGVSIWDTYTHHSGHIADNSNGDIACDHYNRYKEDISLLNDLGVNSYRFSVNWTRIFPDGIGKVNEKGVDFYSRLIDEMLKYGIKPYMTLHHWDYPMELYYKGGWLNRDSSDWFAEYTECIVKRFGDRVKDFITINEPQVIIGCGYDIKQEHAPCLTMDTREHLQIMHNMLLSHGKAAQIIHDNKARVSIAPNSNIYMPLTETKENIEAARKASFGTLFNTFVWSQNYYIDPIVLGDYPKEYYERYSDMLPTGFSKDDLKIISQPLDYLCQNVYDGRFVYATESGEIKLANEKNGDPHTDMGWPVTPEVLYWGVKFMAERYNVPIYISENGTAMPDLVTADKKVHDGARIEYIKRYLTSLKRAASEGVPVDGFFYWTAMDNFEWGHGYKRRFGLIYVDYETQERITKDSYNYYRDIIKTNGKNL